MNTEKFCKCGCGQIVSNPQNTYVLGHSNRDPDVQLKKQQKYMEKYGVTNPSQSKEVKKKKQDTFQQNFGVNHFMQSDVARQKLEQTNLTKYGNKSVFANPQIIEKIKQTRKITQSQTTAKIVQSKRDIYYENLIKGLRLKNLFIPLFTKEEYLGVGSIKYQFQCVTCNNVTESTLDDGMLPRCYHCNPLIQSGGQSQVEYELIQYIKQFSPSRIIKVQNRKEIFPLELDIYLPESQIGIEFNGLYWHSETGGNKDRKYHLTKTEKCQNKNIRLIQIFEDEWNFKKQIVKSRLKHILGHVKYRLYGRKCQIREISAQCKNKFLNKYHIQGEDRSAINLGLFYRNRLVAIMTFSKLRKALGQLSKSNQWELSRFCTISHFVVLGAANKLLNYFEKTYHPIKLITYSDCRWNTGNLYGKLGFIQSHQSSPNYWYLDKTYQKRYHRFNFRKDILKTKLPNFDPNLSEWKNMKNHKYDRIWDCGNLVFTKEFPCNPV